MPHPRRTAPRVAGSRAGKRPAESFQEAPLWLQAAAGWSWRVLIVAAAVVVAFTAVDKVQLLFIGVFIALVFTAVLRPVVNFYARVTPRPLATVLALLSGFLVFAGLLTYVGISVAGQWSDLSTQFGAGINQIIGWIENSPVPFTVTLPDINEALDALQQWVVDNTSNIGSAAQSAVGGVAQFFMVMALAIFCSVFFLTSGAQLWTWFLNQLPTRMRENWNAAGSVGWYTFSGYARGTVIIALIIGILAFIVLTVLGVPLAAPLAVLVFIGTFIPLIGAPAAMVIAMVVALAANGLLNAGLVMIAIALLGQLEGNVLQPLIMGKQVSLHPVVVAIIVTGGTLIAGILGAIIAVPLVAVAWAVFAKLRKVEPPTYEVRTVKRVAFIQKSLPKGIRLPEGIPGTRT